MEVRRLVIPVIVAAAFVVPGTARAQDGIAIAIDKHARLSNGTVVFNVRVTCGPLPGTQDFRQGFAGATQAKSGAEAEGGLSPDIVCDGLERLYEAVLSSFTGAAFRRGPAIASASVTACNVVDDEQVCVHGSIQRQILITERPFP